MKPSNTVKLVLLASSILCMLAVYAAAAYARPWHHRRPVVVRPKVVVTPKKKVVTVSDRWGTEKISEEKLAETVIKKRRIKPDYGLIDFFVYPTTTKIYIDGDYKGLARSLNKNKYSPRVSAGRHIVELKKKNAPTKVIKVTVKAGYKTTIEQD